MASYLHRILKIPTESGKTLDVDGIVMGAGCNAVLENLCFCLTEPGDAVLLPTPYYAAFEFDLVARAGLNIVPVNTRKFHSKSDELANSDRSHAVCEADCYYPNRASLDAAYEAALENQSQPKILLLSHPNNPLGICYPPWVILECIQWAREKKVHLVSDEIYAGSVYQSIHPETGKETFQSALALAAAATRTTAASDSNQDGPESRHAKGLGLGPFVHFVYALSKDFALSGLRVGVAYSENKEIRVPMQKLNDLCQISSQTQVTVQEMLTSPPPISGHDKESGGTWSTDYFLPENHKRMRERSLRLQKVLEECQIPFLKADSGLFLWMDLSEFLPELPEGESSGLSESKESMDARERTLYLELMKDFGLLFTPGRSMRNELPGFFRCVFTAASEAEFALALERIQCFVTAKRK
jgi:Aspartate/tyrosine/aromatic aminotransferase